MAKRPELMKSVRVDGPDVRVQALFYDDGSMRFRIYDSPCVIEEAFLTGNPQDHCIIKLGRPKYRRPKPT